MPSTISGLLVILFAILPGVPGNSLYQRIVGKDRKEGQWSAVIRMIGFSVGGLMLYVLVGGLVNAPLPTYISPTTFTNFTIDRATLLTISWALSGHFIGSVLTSLIFSGIILTINRWSKTTEYPDTWDKFAGKYVEKHWVVVKLNDGDAYTGILERADTSVEQNERDLILKEPAKYSNEEKNYYATTYQYLFLPGSIIASIGVVCNPNDERLTIIGAPIFLARQEQQEEVDHE